MAGLALAVLVAAFFTPLARDQARADPLGSGFFGSPPGRLLAAERAARGDWNENANYAIDFVPIDPSKKALLTGRMTSTLAHEMYVLGKDERVVGPNGFPLLKVTVRFADEIQRDDPALWEWLKQKGVADAGPAFVQAIVRNTTKRAHSEAKLRGTDLRIKAMIEGILAGKSKTRIVREIQQSKDLTSGTTSAGATERQACDYQACYKYADHYDYAVPYRTWLERRRASKLLKKLLEPLKDAAEQQQECFTTINCPPSGRNTSIGQARLFDVPESSGTPAARFMRALAAAGAASPGGIDFTSLQLRYVSTDVSAGNSGVGYAFRADPSVDGNRGSVAQGVYDAAEASDAFFVWLSLAPQTFWVNLNPDEPDRIIDAQFGRTDAGRVLLEADLQLKKSVARLIRPSTTLGDRFWAGLRSAPGQPKCFKSRVWITPAPATVRESGDALYILDAPLNVQVEADYFKQQGRSATSACPRQPAWVDAQNERFYRQLVIPRLKQVVNHAPEYAALRRVYLSRVAAEWYRDRSRTQQTTFGRLIDSGNIDPWAMHGSWTPRVTYNAYVRSVRNGEFHVRRAVTQGNVTHEYAYIFGGVDFTTVPTDQISAAEFDARWPGWADAAQHSLGHATLEPGTHETWLGGVSHPDPAVLARGWPDNGRTSGSASHNPSSQKTWFVVAGAVVGVALILSAVLIEVRRRRKAAG